MPDPDSLSEAYYTRFQIWQGLVRSDTDYDPSELKEAADLGYEFIWRDGSDVFKEEVKDEPLPFEKEDPTKGTYL